VSGNRRLPSIRAAFGFAETDRANAGLPDLAAVPRHPDIRGLAGQIVDAYGAERLMWGSDWPWTQHEAVAKAAALLPEALGLDGATIAEMEATAQRVFFESGGEFGRVTGTDWAARFGFDARRRRRIRTSFKSSAAISVGSIHGVMRIGG